MTDRRSFAFTILQDALAMEQTEVRYGPDLADRELAQAAVQYLTAALRRLEQLLPVVTRRPALRIHTAPTLVFSRDQIDAAISAMPSEDLEAALAQHLEQQA